MYNELLLLFENYTDVLIQQTKIKTQEKLETEMNKQIKTSHFHYE